MIIFCWNLQLVSIRWYLWGPRGVLKRNNNNVNSNNNNSNNVNNVNSNCDINNERKKTVTWSMGCIMLLHATQVGVLWRYFKLFIPVNLAYVKHEVSTF